MQIAIDGPSGAGKSTIAKAVAKVLGILYIDTGAMYRAAGLKAARLNLNPDDWDGINEMLKQTTVDLRYRDGEQHVILDGVDVSNEIRTPEISRWASDISAVPACRIKMVERQREIASEQDVVMDGRDITSYVLPEADVKIFLTADLDVRAARRYEDSSARIGEQTIDAVKEDLAFRDKQDSERAFAPLVKTDDAIEIDSSGMDIDDVVACVLNRVREKTSFFSGKEQPGT